MTGKKQYYQLDNIGFIGTQQKKSEADIKKDIELTVQFIKKRKAEQRTPPATITRATKSK
ncbi:hypothetical protein [Deminuibacter soli]|uniref:Uncharacterized protein n=1 Tax=Deminuibacter soli TaxID=2291815 RepID=A0A3E1NH31_9BACT|nr:hypothetical protein [Deminuibacter soli]RFM27266.1 hypothetical protein DXN05_14635 [Deminuibacter soli]